MLDLRILCSVSVASRENHYPLRNIWTVSKEVYNKSLLTIFFSHRYIFL